MRWSDPGPVEVAPGVHRVPLPIPDAGLRAVNVYVLDDGDGLTLVDGGWAYPEGRQALDDALAVLGRRTSDIARFLVTHVHHDHLSQAVVVSRETGAQVLLGRGEQESLDVLLAPDFVSLRGELGDLTRHGAADVASRLAALSVESPEAVRDLGRADEWLDDGSSYAVGGRTVDAVPTPGHTHGHVVFQDVAGGLVFSGDHVLPHITPSIGYEVVRRRDPLGDFLRSLALVRSRPDGRLLPAHGEVGPSAHARVDELLVHHERRLDETRAALEAGAVTAYDAARRLRWTRRGRSFEELDPFNAGLAVLETAAHLDVLTVQGGARRCDQGEAIRYVA